MSICFVQIKLTTLHVMHSKCWLVNFYRLHTIWIILNSFLQVRTKLFTRKQGDREGVSNTVILIMDQKNYGKSKFLFRTAEQLKSDGTKVSLYFVNNKWGGHVLVCWIDIIFCKLWWRIAAFLKISSHMCTHVF